MKQVRELITEGYKVHLTANVYVADLPHQACFLLTVEVPVGREISRNDVLKWAAELSSELYLADLNLRVEEESAAS